MKNKNRIIVVSEPRFLRLKNIHPDVSTMFNLRRQKIFNIGIFTPFENRFSHHLDGGLETYRIWFASQLELDGPFREQMQKMYFHYHYSDHDNSQLVLMHNEELPPVHAQIIKTFIETRGAKL